MQKSRKPHIYQFSSFLFPYLFIEDQHMTHSSFAYFYIYLMARFIKWNPEGKRYHFKL